MQTFARTAEGAPLLENRRAELRRHLARLRVVGEQIRANLKTAQAIGLTIAVARR
ncbi:hypothetical protein [Bradyrhizobium japonicum]|uniref:hypothetical protein n=1 Tax=Bradyrhizobium japonicum TaxID=375 RepID=UPI0004B07B76|nr:hypothetical protein [Bradyrhizobium japonicum]